MSVEGTKVAKAGVKRVVIEVPENLRIPLSELEERLVNRLRLSKE